MEFQEDIERSLAVLSAGGLILYPTDTIWGIGCDATNEAAVTKVYQLKNREETKAMIVLMADEKSLLRYVASPDPMIPEYLKGTVKPTTIIYEGAIGLASNLIGVDGSIAIRLTGDEFCRHLIKRFRKPIVSTSANLSGDPAPGVYNDISESVKAGVDFIVRYRQNDPHPGLPSSIIRWVSFGKPVIIRP